MYSDKGRVTMRIPKQLFGEGSPTDWPYAAAVLSQEGFPAPGVRRVRDAEPTQEQWRVGGGDGSINGTRILDLIADEPGLQETMLSAYEAVTTGSVNDLDDDFAQITPVASP